jgi:hypothetical protein
MTKRRTLELPDAPGVWLWNNTPRYHMNCVRIFMDDYGSLCYVDDGMELGMDTLSQDYPGGRWQGPIEWEEDTNTCHY